MIKKILYSILLLYILFGCNDDLTFQSELENNVVLYCVLNADSNTQYAMLKKNFSEKHSNENHYIKNAKITLKQNKSKNEFSDTSIVRGNIETDFYYSKNIKPPSGAEMGITVQLPNGEVLTSSLIVPKFSLFVFEKSILTIPDSQNPTRLFVGWTLLNANDNLSFLTRLSINYKVSKNGIETSHLYVVPVEYVIKNDNKLPIYPTTQRTSAQIYTQRTINLAFQKLSEGDTSKSSYTIMDAEFEVFIMEENLANYSASIETFNNTYSVKVYEPQISNIQGGLGVFGAYVKQSKEVIVDKDYIESFGYKYEREE